MPSFLKLDVIHLDKKIDFLRIKCYNCYRKKEETKMTKFDLIYDMISGSRGFDIERWSDETETDFGLIQFYSYKNKKSYQMLWDKDTIIEFKEVS